MYGFVVTKGYESLSPTLTKAGPLTAHIFEHTAFATAYTHARKNHEPRNKSCVHVQIHERP